MQNMKPICQGLFYLSRHIKSVDRRTVRQTDRQTDRKGYYYRAPAFSMQGPNKYGHNTFNRCLFKRNSLNTVSIFYSMVNFDTS